ncbi:hypothetical protein KIPB_013130 [Kipferlia bialata]|uniref:Uncharacterized protein n=1 Tax=Kipferlia bialata TaxID=797122 RepID=A0A391P0T6_9EUKA|nr:hypothetical protein KIPB_013130 [Kipferlia bialata]|eukprot:g13130.t1
MDQLASLVARLEAAVSTLEKHGVSPASVTAESEDEWPASVDAFEALLKDNIAPFVALSEVYHPSHPLGI